MQAQQELMEQSQVVIESLVDYIREMKTQVDAQNDYITTLTQQVGKQYDSDLKDLSKP